MHGHLMAEQVAESPYARFARKAGPKGFGSQLVNKFLPALSPWECIPACCTLNLFIKLLQLD